MIDNLNIKILPLTSLPFKIKKIDDEYYMIDEGIYEVDGELCCTQNTYDEIKNNPEERKRFDRFIANRYIEEYMSCK